MSDGTDSRVPTTPAIPRRAPTPRRAPVPPTTRRTADYLRRRTLRRAAPLAAAHRTRSRLCRLRRLLRLEHRPRRGRLRRSRDRHPADGRDVRLSRLLPGGAVRHPAHAGGGYGFARRALGTWGGFLTGTAILIEYILAPAAISLFIGEYVESLNLFGLTAGWPVCLACFALFIGIHLWGVGEALRFSLVVTAVAVAALLIFAVGAFTEFDTAGLNDIPVDQDAFGSGSWLPFGVLASGRLPVGMWFFLGWRGALAAEEAKDPVRSMPKALSISMAVLALLALITFFAATGAAARPRAGRGNPLVGRAPGRRERPR